MKLDAYIRVSRVNGREGDSFISPEQQRDKIAAWAKLRGVKIVKWHEPDLDQSGGKLSRPNFDRALERVRTGKADGIVVAKLDRFSRAGVADALKLIESIIEAGGQVASVEEGIDPTTPSGEFVMTLFLALARMQRRQIGDNWKDSQRRAVERGVHIASRAPTGYVRANDSRLVPHAEFAPHIGRVFEMKAAGASWRDLALYLREQGVESPYGTTHWQPRALSHLIANRAYLGEARCGEFTKVGAHPALVDEATWQAAQEAKGQRPVNGMGGSLLAGVLRCGGCGYVLKPDTMKGRDGSKLRLYRCRTERSSGRCPSPASVLGSVIEPFVVDTMLTGLTGMRGKGAVLSNDLRAAEKALQRAERELATYLEAVSADDVGAEAFAAAARQRRDAADRARTAYEKMRERAGLAELPRAVEVEAEWPNLSVAGRNRLVRAAFDAVVLSRGRLPIEQRAQVFWRGEASSTAGDSDNVIGITRPRATTLNRRVRDVTAKGAA
jgi:site-specific DNA recombinase